VPIEMCETVPCVGLPWICGGELFTSVPFTTGGDAADVEPPLTYPDFVTVSTTRRVFPTSAATGLYVVRIAPEMTTQLPPLELHRFH